MHGLIPTNKKKKAQAENKWLNILPKSSQVRKEPPPLIFLPLWMRSSHFLFILCLLHLTFNCGGHWGTTDDFTTSLLHFSLFSTALSDFMYSRHVHSLMLSSHLFFCLSCLLSPFAVPCKMVLARADEREPIPLQFVSLYDVQKVFLWSDCLLDLGTDFLIGSMVLVQEALYLAVAPHFHGLYSSLELCCEGP